MTQCKFCGSYNVSYFPPESTELPLYMLYAYFECADCGKGWRVPMTQLPETRKEVKVKKGKKTQSVRIPSDETAPTEFVTVGKAKIRVCTTGKCDL